MLAANHGSVLTALAAAREAKVRRFILVSVPGASVDATHPCLRAKGLAEEAVVNSGLEHAIVRSTHVYGLGGLWFTSVVEGALTVPPFVVGSGEQIVAPVLADDLAAVIVAADDHVGDLCGTWALEGPDALSAAELVGRLTPTGVDPVPVPADAAALRLTERLGASVSVLASEFFALPSRADAPDAASAFGVERTPFDQGLRRTMERPRRRVGMLRASWESSSGSRSTTVSASCASIGLPRTRSTIRPVSSSRRRSARRPSEMTWERSSCGAGPGSSRRAPTSRRWSRSDP
jgi:nucleoside-diphosphate-sugar epimerase